MFKKFLAGSIFAISAASPLFAADGTVTFNGAVTSTCVLNVGSPGVISANAGYTELNSKNAGGAAGTATVVTTSSEFDLSTSAPNAFTSAPTDGGTNVTFASSYSASGVTNVTDVAGTVLTSLDIGLTNVSVDMSATKSSGTFPQGNYVADVTVTCE